MTVKQKPALLEVLAEKIRSDTYFTKSQKDYITEQVKQIDPGIKQKFAHAYSKWDEECSELVSKEGFEPYVLEDCRGFKSMESLKALGKATVSLYMEMLARMDFLPLIPYNEIQEPGLQSHAEDGNLISYSALYQTVHAVDLWLASHHMGRSKDEINQLLTHPKEERKTKKQLFEEFKEKVRNDEYFSLSQKAYIKKEVEEVNPIIKESFSHAYVQWGRDCVALLRKYHLSNAYKCNKLESMQNLKDLSQEVMPLYIAKLAYGAPLPLALIPYIEVQEMRLLVPDDPTDPYSYDMQAQAIRCVDLWLADHHIV